MGVSDDLADDAIMRSVRAIRAGNAIWKDLLPILKRAERELVQKVEDIGATRSFQSTRAERMLREIRRTIDGGAQEFYKRLEVSGVDLAGIEAQATADSFTKRIPIEYEFTVPAARLMKSVATELPFEGAILRDHLSKWSADTIFRMQGELRTALLQGETIEQMQRRLRGVAEIKINNARTLAKTYAAHITNGARAETYAANADVIAGEMWTATLDDRTCLRCGPLDNKVYEIGKGPKPPLHMNCLPGDSLVTPCGDVSLVSKRWFEGDLVIISTSAGRKLTITPNHLIATRRGWVAAKSLNSGDQVVCNSGSERAVACYDLRDNREARIEDVAEAFFRNSGVMTAEVPVSSPDFHGDGAKSKIAIIGANGGLRAQEEPPAFGHSHEFPLDPRGATVGAFVRLGSLAKFIKPYFASARRYMGRLGERLNIFGRRAIHTGLLLFAGVPQRDVIIAQNEFYLGAYQPKTLCDACRADAGRINLADFTEAAARFFKRVHVGKWSSANFDALFFEDDPNGLLVDSNTFCDRLNRQAGLVEFDDVISVDVQSGFSGHVYNLETTKNVYLAENIVVHNCRCVRVPVIKGREELIKAGLLKEGTRASIDGQVPDSLKFEDWLRRQSTARQKEVLGAKRLDLWKKGMKLDKFVNDENQIVPLDELGVIRGAAPSRPTAALLSQMNIAAKSEVLEKGRNSGVEHLVAIDESTGSVIERGGGSKSFVGFSDKLNNLTKDASQSLMMHHNHPSSSSLSVQDVIMAMRPGISGVWAHGHNGSSYFVARTEKVLADAKIKSFEKKVYNNLQQMVFDKKLTAKSAGLVHNHFTWLAMSKKGLLKYEATIEGDRKAAFDEVADVLSGLLEKL